MPSKPGSVDTLMRVIPTMLLPEQVLVVRLRPKPSLDDLRRVIEPLLEGQRLEHVAVLFDGERRDLFVGEMSATLPRNLRATAIYHNAALDAIERGIRTYADYPEPWPSVCGPAVLFPERRVWF